MSPSPSNSRPTSLAFDPHYSPSSPIPRSRTPALKEQDEQRQAVQEQCGHLRLCDNPAFELLVLGCGGGPIETNLSSFVVKPYNSKWTEGCTGIEGGSTIGALANLIERNPYAFEGFGLEIGVDEGELDATTAALAHAAKNGHRESVPLVGVGRDGGGKSAAKVWDLISCFAITHAHLDHIAGLIISSAACRPPPKPVWGIKRTIQNIERLMDGGVWPMLGGWDDSVTLGRAYHYKHIPTPCPEPLPLSPGLTFTAHPLSHGLDPSFFTRKNKPPDANGEHKACTECYDSTAFFVKEEQSGKELLFFGDVEPDSISKKELNLNIWKIAAPKIASGKLNIIFLECSYPSSQPANQLYGHFSPPYILEEMVVLAELVKKERIQAGLPESVAAMDPLQDVIVVIQHIKDDIFALPKPASSPRPPSFPATPPPSAGLPTPVPNTASTTGEKDLPPLPPPKDDAAAPTLPTKPFSRPSSLVLLPQRKDPLSAAPLLSMSPPVPSAPTRRPSAAGVFAFPSSPLATALSRNSYRQSTSGEAGLGAPFGALSLSVGANSSAGAAWQNSFAFAERRASTPSPFGFGANNPFIRGNASRLSVAFPHTAPPGSAALLDIDSAARFGNGERRSLSPGSISPGTRVTARSPTRMSQYAFPAVVTEEEEGLDSVPPSPTPELTEQQRHKAQSSEAEEELLAEDEEEMIDETVHERIERELNELEQKEKTGVKFLIAVQGMRLVF